MGSIIIFYILINYFIMILGRYKLYIYNYIYILILYVFQYSYKSWILNKYILIYILHHTIFIL